MLAPLELSFAPADAEGWDDLVVAGRVLVEEDARGAGVVLTLRERAGRDPAAAVSFDVACALAEATGGEIFDEEGHALSRTLPPAEVRARLAEGIAQGDLSAAIEWMRESGSLLPVRVAARVLLDEQAKAPDRPFVVDALVWCRVQDPWLVESLREEGCDLEALLSDAEERITRARHETVEARAAAQRAAAEALATQTHLDDGNRGQWIERWAAGEPEALAVLASWARAPSPADRAPLGEAILAALDDARGRATERLLEALARMGYGEAVARLDAARLRGAGADPELVAHVLRALGRATSR